MQLRAQPENGVFILKFEDYQLRPEILETLRQNGIENCTAIQTESIPHVLEGRDISGLSQTGSGKTFAFLVPLFDRLLRSFDQTSTDELDIKRRYSSWNKGHFILILAPTRELADQIHKNVVLLAKNTPIKSVLVYGGVDYDTQTGPLSEGVDIVVGTPGRLIDLYKNHHLNFRQIKAVIFDEADRMFDMGFKDDMIYVLQRAPKDRQILSFSATLNFDVTNTIYRFGADPIEINVSKDQAKATDVVDEIFHVGDNDKPGYLLSLIKRTAPKQTIIFSNYKNNVERITEFLNKNGIPAVGISSLLTQSQRERVLEQFKNENESNTLVATDVAARGLDIKGVDLVFNYDLPDDAENYVHRIGRTGRAGAKGTAFSLVSDRDVQALGRIEDYLKQKITIGWLDDDALVKDFSPVPRDDYRRESSVRKTGLAAVKSAQGASGPRRNDNRKFGNRNNNNRDRDTNRDSRSNEDRAPRSAEGRNDQRPRHDSRPPQRNDRPEGRDSKRDPRHDRHNSSAPTGGAQVHRDRQSGRHQTQNQNQNKDFKNGSAPKKQSYNNHNNKKNYNKSFKKSSSHATGSSNTVGTKIKSFFKTLFGK